MANKYNLLSNMGYTVQDAGLYQGQVYIHVDTKRYKIRTLEAYYLFCLLE